jgi:predicted Zn-dependent protease
MKQISFIAATLLAVLTLFYSSKSFAQANPAASVPHRETTQDLVAKLNPQQKQQFDDAGKAYGAHRYADSLAIHQLLLKDFPGDPILLKFASEAALQNGDAAFAMKTLKPLAQADPDDWQAAAMLTRACAETGDKACRDAGMAHMLDLHGRGITPPQLQQYAVESVKLGDNALVINISLVPWGNYKVYDLGKVTDGAGKLLLSITLESNDFDQPGFAKEHPDEAAKGMRRFSIDTYRETGTDSAGHRTQTQGLYKFIDGQPPYETIREEFLKLASGQGSPIGSRTGLTVQ